MTRLSKTIERTNVKGFLWRKKVDNTIFRDMATPIPLWVVKGWNIEKYFPTSNSVLEKKNKHSKVKIVFLKKEYGGNVICSKKGLSKYFRLCFSEDLLDEIQKIYNMSNMRNIEAQLRGNMDNLEKEIPFWEFIDIEFIESEKKFIFTDHYKQESTFPELFKRLKGSPAIKSIEDEIFNKKGFRIHKQNWKKIEEINTEIGAKNVIYYLINKKSKEIYIGEAEDFIERIKIHLKDYPSWEYYRYDKLPSSFNKDMRLSLERMVIRSFASFLPNLVLESFNISNYKLINKKIDK